MNTSVAYVRNKTTVEKLVHSWIFWVLFLVTMFSYPIYRSVNRELPPPLPKLYKVPNFNLINEFGKPFSNKNLSGKFYIANFIFTSCPTSCPGLMAKMQKIQKRIKGLGTKVAIATFTVDPETDTAKVLHKYARDYHANPFVWSFLTGEEKKIKKLLIDGFKVPVGEQEAVEKVVEDKKITVFDIAHSEKLVLVDKDGFIRGYYSVDDNSVNKLMIDLGLLVNRDQF